LTVLGADRAGSHGFTLMEVLVALAITSVLAALVLQFLVQASHLDAQTSRYLEGGAPPGVRQVWLRDAVAAAQSSAPDGRRAFEGNHATMTLVSPDAIVRSGPGYGRLVLAIERLPEGGSVLVSQVPGVAESAVPSGGVTPLPLMRWPFEQVRFRYRDGSGVWGDAWPPAGAVSPAPAIPSAVMIEVPLSPIDSIVVDIPNSPKQLPPRRDTLDD
jgi:prepilin-type N-terminal cleavage/methylation domain-containing protein